MHRSVIYFLLLLLFCWSTLSAQDGTFDWQQGRELQAGIRYTRLETAQPRKMVIHGVQIDALTPGLRLHTTSRRDEWVAGKTETSRQTTRDFLRQSREHGIPTVLAINADAFAPWPAPYDQPTPTDLAGLAVSDGTLVSQGSGSPSLIQKQTGELGIEVTGPDVDASAMKLAVSGFALCLDNGEPIRSGEDLHPRTGLGLSQDGRYLVVVAIDGRQPASLGATTQELGQWLRHFGAHRGINMDGGGSTTLAWWDASSADADKCQLLNRPVGNGVKAEQLSPELFAPSERANGNNLGVAIETPQTSHDAPPAAGSSRPIVGAIRWDAWYGEGSPVSEVEKTLGPKKYHFRLPFFAQVISPGEVSINGDSQAVIEQEISYAADAGLDYWAFVDYWDQGNLGIALRRYRDTPDKKGIRYCLIEEGRRLDHIGTEGWPRLVTHFQDPNYVKVLDGRPLLFVFGLPEKLGKADFEQLTQQAAAAGVKEPYLVLMGWNPKADAVAMQRFGFHALSAYAAGVGYEWEQWPYAKLTEHVRTAYWEVCRSERLEMVTFVTAGWDPRPRVEHPTPWVRVTPRPDPTPPELQTPLVDAVTATPDQIAQHLREAIAWTHDNRDLNRANAVIIYGWNENDEGGWLIPTLQSDGQIDRARVDAVSTVLRETAFSRPDASQ